MKRALNYKQLREAVHGPHEQIRTINKVLVERELSRRIEIRVNRFAVAEKPVAIIYEMDNKSI